MPLVLPHDVGTGRVPGLRGWMTIEEACYWPQLEAANEVNTALLEFLASTAALGGVVTVMTARASGSLSDPFALS